MSEPWLSGPRVGIDPLVAPLFYCFAQTRQELGLHTEGLTPDDLWSRPFGTAPAGFHIRHIGGAAERLSTYLCGDQLSEAQLIDLRSEAQPGATREQLLQELDKQLSRCEQLVRAIDPSRLREPREVGRKRLPTTVIGLIVHIAEHTQRHLGQAITTIKLVRSLTAQRSG
jgi:hypothetical protein